MKILATRFSALGDVALSVPVLRAVAEQNPNCDITVMSKSFCEPLFEGLPENVHFMGIDLMNDYRGLGGLRRLVRECGVADYDCVADLHDVLRTKYIRFYAMLHNVRVASIDKDRCGRAALVRQRDKQLVQQKRSPEKYADVFRQLGLKVTLNTELYKTPSSQSASAIAKIGIAPFAAHEGKIYPIEKMREAVQQLSASGRCYIYLFGGGQRERDILEAWERDIPNVESVAGRLGGLKKELELMRTLSLMVSMDSANMHLASLAEIPVVSIWGATHPLGGFMGWGQTEDNALQANLPCRPCSIFGNKPCLRGDYACLNNITPTQIVSKVLSLLNAE